MACQRPAKDSVDNKFSFGSHLNLEDMYIKYDVHKNFCDPVAMFFFSFSSLHACSRARQEKFASDRNWEQYHTPRNLLLAMVKHCIVFYVLKTQVYACYMLVSCASPSYSKREKGSCFHVPEEFNRQCL